jgi:hypothetical protein
MYGSKDMGETWMLTTTRSLGGNKNTDMGKTECWGHNKINGYFKLYFTVKLLNNELLDFLNINLATAQNKTISVVSSPWYLMLMLQYIATMTIIINEILLH